MKTAALLSGPALAALLLALGGCAGVPAPQPPWRVEPVQALRHGGAPAAAEAVFQRGRGIEHAQDLPRAAEAYREALRLDPGHVRARNALAVALARLGRLDEAERELRAALAAAPARAELHSNLGYLLLLAQRPGEALAPLQAALRLDPQDRVAQANLRLAQARAPAAVPPPAARAQAGAPATPAAATSAQAAVLPAAGSAALPLQVVDRATVGPLALAVPERAPAAAPPAEAAPARPADGAAPSTAAAAPDAGPGLALELSNGLGRPGAAQALRRRLQQQGFEVRRIGNGRSFRQPVTVVLYRPGQEAAARRVAAALPLARPLLREAPVQRADVCVLLGHDWPEALTLADAGTPRARE